MPLQGQNECHCDMVIGDVAFSGGANAKCQAVSSLELVVYVASKDMRHSPAIPEPAPDGCHTVTAPVTLKHLHFEQANVFRGAQSVRTLFGKCTRHLRMRYCSNIVQIRVLVVPRYSTPGKIACLRRAAPRFQESWGRQGMKGWCSDPSHGSLPQGA